MANDDLRFLPAADLAAAIARRKVSPVDAVKAVLDAIDDTKTLNAWVTVDADAALKAARAAERAVMRRGVRLGPLHGVPFGVKDLVITKGVRTTFGTPLYRDNVPTEDAPSVARMKAAGGIMIGKTNTPTFGWVGVTDNLIFGLTRNPWTPSARRAARRAAREPRSPPEWRRSTSAPTAAAPFASRRPSPAPLASRPRTAACPCIRPARRGASRTSAR